MKLNYPNLYAGLWRATDWAVQVRQNDLLKAVIAGKPDEVSDPLLFAKFVEVRTGKGRIPPEPKLSEPKPVAVNQWRDKIQDPIG
jgi:hypothetical protein